MAIPFSGQISEADYLRAQTLNLRRSPMTLGCGAIFVLIMLSAILPLLSKPEPSVLFATLPIVIVGVFLAGILYWSFRSQIKKSWRNSTVMQGAISGTATEEHIEIRNATSESNTSWSAFTRYVQTPEMLLLYCDPAATAIFPKGFFSDEADWTSFVQLVQENVPLKQTTGTVNMGRWLLLGLAYIAALVLIALVLILFR